ncbi:MAG: hypothetical protein KQH59_12875 [Desulfobulbaceae bacterium]|nr:hypothetical protein [Desulfobulbaceae bacterium]
MNLKALQHAGGREWFYYHQYRVYFNRLKQRYGLAFEYAATGGIARATLNGQPISVSEARELSACLDTMKIWFDLRDRSFHHKLGDQPDCRKVAIAEAIISGIKEEIRGGA